MQVIPGGCLACVCFKLYDDCPLFLEIVCDPLTTPIAPAYFFLSKTAPVICEFVWLAASMIVAGWTLELTRHWWRAWYLGCCTCTEGAR